MLVLGDSAALTLGNGLERWANDTGQAQVWNAGKLGCSVGRGGLIGYLGQVRSRLRLLRLEPSRSPSEIAGIQPHVIVALFGTWDVVDRQLPGDPSGGPSATRSTTRTCAARSRRPWTP